jgi:hypothetical protein
MMRRADALNILGEAFEAVNIRHFQPEEFFPVGRLVCPAPLLLHVLPTVRVLEDARNVLGAIRVNSAYRDPIYNKSIGGAPRSQHIQNTAVDASPLEVPADVLWEFIINHTHANRLGAGRYDTFVHVDCRHWVSMPEYGLGPARWDNRNVS